MVLLGLKPIRVTTTIWCLALPAESLMVTLCGIPHTISALILVGCLTHEPQPVHRKEGDSYLRQENVISGQQTKHYARSHLSVMSWGVSDRTKRTYLDPPPNIITLKSIIYHRNKTSWTQSKWNRICTIKIQMLYYPYCIFGSNTNLLFIQINIHHSCWIVKQVVTSL